MRMMKNNNNETVMVIGIDHGYGNMKTATRCFPSGVARYDKEPIFQNNLLFYRDPYMLDFLGLRDTYSEKDLENAILAELEKFILEMGSDFAFLARQKHFVLDGKDYYMDLLFYHRGLRRLVLVELKLGEFEPQDKGQVELYLRWLEKNERVEGEESPVALILCAEKSQETIELMQLDHGNIHVGQYMTKMPPKELLEQKLSLAIANARELLEQRKEE